MSPEPIRTSDEAGGWVELRVHGVSGTPPEELLGVPHVQQVAGDDYSRFFRPVDGDGDHVLEAYHWGRFTSGTWRQGLALLLVPFGLVNAAQFMLPAPVTWFGKVMHLVAGTCLRVLALVLTALFSFTLGLILIDIVAWRWAPGTSLFENAPFTLVVLGGALAAALGVVALALLGRSGGTRTPPDPVPGETPSSTALDPGFFAGDPNAPTMRALHVAGGLAVIALLLALTRQGGEATLGWPLFPVAVLGVVTLAVIAVGDPERTVTVGFSAATGDGSKARRRRFAQALLALSVILLVGEGWLTGRELRDVPSVADRPIALSDFDHVANGLMLAAVLALGLLHTANLFLVWRGGGLGDWTRHDAAIRLGVLAPALVVALLVLLVSTKPWLTGFAIVVAACTLALAAIATWRSIAPGRTGPPADEHYFRPFAGGMTPFLLTTLSVFVGVGMSAAAANGVAAALPSVEGTTPGSDVASTEMLDRVGYAWGLTVAELLVLALAGLVIALRARRAYRERVDEDYARPTGDATVLPDGWRDRVATAMAAAQGKQLLPVVIIVFVAVGLLISGVQVFETFLEADHAVGPAWLDRLSQPRSAQGAAPIIGVGTWLLLAVAGYVVAVSRGAISNRNLRRAINIVWDVFSFWPHAVHPFVPRPYSRWTVIELRNRIRHHLGGPGGGLPAPETTAPGRRVVVVAHSQGSLIAYAALLKLAPHEREQVAFLSCGSQLRVIYPRAFPAYVNLATHRALFDGLDGAWINLYRLTDPLAGPVLSWAHAAGASRHLRLRSDGDLTAADDDFPAGEHRCRRCGNDWRLIDPIPYDADVETGAVTAIHGHHDYWGDPSWPRALAALRTPQA